VSDDLNRRIAELRGEVQRVSTGGGTDVAPEIRQTWPRYDSDPAQSMVLLEELLNAFVYADLLIGRAGPKGRIIHVSLPADANTPDYLAEGATLRQAVARAWLAWRE